MNVTLATLVQMKRNDCRHVSVPFGAMVLQVGKKGEVVGSCSVDHLSLFIVCHRRNFIVGL